MNPFRILAGCALLLLTTCAVNQRPQQPQQPQRPQVPVQSPRGQRRPNVLLVIFDDLNRDLPIYGHNEVKAPNMVRFARRAVRFDRAYAQYPLCSPSRTSFLSGRRPEETGVFDNVTHARTRLEHATFLPEHFRNNGYHTARVGKVFHVGLDDPRSWDVSEEGTPGNVIAAQGHEEQKFGQAQYVIERGNTKGLHKGAESRWAIFDAGDEIMVDHMIAKRASQYLHAATKGEKPFFVAVGFRRPHAPWNAPKKYFDMYPPESIAPLPPQTARHPDVPAEQEPLPLPKYQQAVRAYHAVISFADAQFGTVLDTMDELDLWKNTIVVVMGDHGYHMGTRMWWGKNTPYDDAAAAPFLVAAPGRSAGTSTRGVVEFLDLFPTLTDLAGLPTPDGVVGKSFSPLLDQPDAAWDKPAFTVLGKQGATARAVSGQHLRLIRWHQGERDEAFDIDADPREQVNLVDETGYAAQVEQLRKQLSEYQARR